MRILKVMTAGLLVTAGIALAPAVPQSRISSNAKWLIHFDLGQFRETPFGAAFLAKVRRDHLDTLEKDLREDFGLKFDFNQLQSVTAYGTDFKSEPDQQGVLLLQSGQNLDNLVEQLEIPSLKEKGIELKLDRITVGGTELLHVNQEFFLTFADSGKLAILGKTRPSVLEAGEVVAGKRRNLSVTDRFEKFPKVGNDFFFMAMADSFAHDLPVPPKARFLQQAEGGRILLGEEGKNLVVRLDLLTSDEETTRQVRQVMEGMLALLRLGQQDENLKRLLGGTRIDSTDRLVSVELRVSTQQVLDKLAEVDHP